MAKDTDIKEPLSEFGRKTFYSNDPTEVYNRFKLRQAKEHVLNLVNEIQHKHGKYRASLAGKPKLVYSEGHDMSKLGEGKPYGSK